MFTAGVGWRRHGVNLSGFRCRSGDHSMSPAAVRPPSIAILIAITAIGPLALNIFLPSLPGLVSVFHTDYGTAQLALTLYLVGIAGGQLIYGPLSDRFGRRPVLLAGLAVFVTGSLMAALAGSIGMLI